MITAEQNEPLVRTNAGTLMGDLFRRYWMPALHAWELAAPDCAPVRVKLLGESLVAFRDSQNRMPYFEVVEFEGGLLIGARRNAENNRYYWRITPWIMPLHSIIPPRADHPLSAHVWVPIDDENCWAWSINYHTARALTDAERNAMKSGKGIHNAYVPGTFTPLQNRRNDYRMDRAAQKEGVHYSGIEGIAMQDRTRENLCPTDRGIVMTRRMLLAAAEANRSGGRIPALDPAAQRVRSCAIELERDQPFNVHAQHGLFAPPDTAPVSV